MKTLRISDDIHRKLTATVGTLMAQTGEMQTYQDAIEAMLTRSVILPTGMLAELAEYGLKRWDVTRRIQRMNKKLMKELGQKVAEKKVINWRQQVS